MDLTGCCLCRAAPINQSLAAGFGFFPIDWTGMAVPWQGGVIVESFVTDEVTLLPVEIPLPLHAAVNVYLLLPDPADQLRCGLIMGIDDFAAAV